MLEEQKEIDVEYTRIFEKSINKLSESNRKIVEDEIDNIILDPEIGTQKKGDLSYLWVHKFKINNQEFLLGYSWIEDSLKLYLLNFGSHENFYKNAKKRRKADLKIVS